MGLLAWILNLGAAPAGVTRYWYGVDADPTKTTNWVATEGGSPPASVPGTGDTAIFPATGCGAQPCTLSADWTIKTFTVNPAQTGKINLSTHALTIESGGAITLAGGGEFDCGSGSHSVTDATFNSEDQDTVTRDFATWTFNGACTVSLSTDYLRNITIAESGTTTVPAGKQLRVQDGTLTINGNLAVATGSEARAYQADVVFGAAGTLSGAGVGWSLYPGAGKGVSVFPEGAEISIDEFRLTARDASVLAGGGVFSAKTIKLNAISYDASVVLGASDYVFQGTLEVSTNSSHPLTIDGATNSTPSVTVQGGLTLATATGDLEIAGDAPWALQGDVTDSITDGAFTWTPEITLSGSADQDVDLHSVSISALTIAKSDGTVTASGAITATTFVGTSGTLDPNGQAITTTGDCTWSDGFDMVSDADAMNGSAWIVGGAFVADGQTLNATASWTLSVAGDATASSVSVAYSDASGSTDEIDATDGCTELTADSCVNWLFLVSSTVDGTLSVAPSVRGRVEIEPSVDGGVSVAASVRGRAEVSP